MTTTWRPPSASPCWGERSLGKAAERAGLTRWEFEELLEDAGFTALYGPRTQEQLDDELDAVRDQK